MSAVFEIPIETDADGVIRVAGTRVTMDTLVAAFNEGATAGGNCPAVSLA
jgi:hypothetical protein